MSPTPSAATILATPPAAAVALFPGDADAVRAGFHALALLWHPDRSRDPLADAVFTHLVALRDAALGRAIGGAPAGTCGAEGGERALRRHGFELGELLVRADALAWCLDPAHSDLARRGLARIASLPFADGGMRGEMRALLPEVRTVAETGEGIVVAMRRDPGSVLLRDLLAHAGGTLPPRHAAWITSGLHHLACYLGFAGLVHGDIGPDTVLVAPERHAVALPGGWWYATPAGASLDALPLRTAELLPPRALDAGVADPAIDRLLIRATARALADPAAQPEPVRRWLREEGFAGPVEEYRRWREVLRAGFGPRRFATLPITADQVYR